MAQKRYKRTPIVALSILASSIVAILPAHASTWKSTSTIDPISDAAVDAASTRGKGVLVVLRCTREQTKPSPILELYSEFDRTMDSGLPLTIRIDKNLPVRCSTKHSTAHSALFLDNNCHGGKTGKQPVDVSVIIRQMVEGNRMLIRAYPWASDRIDTSVSLAGFTSASKKALSHCLPNWREKSNNEIRVLTRRDWKDGETINFQQEYGN